jgi:4-amino-4-deoxy-L-arabinose transferase-like glycosyltransferase
MSQDSSSAQAESPQAEVSPAGGRARSFRAYLLLVVVYAAAIYLPFLGSSRRLTRHEVSVADPALTILKTGEWLVPQFVGQAWVHKPPLVIWMTTGVFAAWGGFDEFAARLPAALSAIALCVAVAVVAWRFYGALAGLFAGLVQATCVYMYTWGRLGELDMPFALLVACGHFVLAWRWGRGLLDLPLGYAATFHVLAGLAVLAKGPLAIIFFGMTVLVYCLARRSVRPLKAVLMTPAMPLSLILGFWWYVAAGIATRGEATGDWMYSYVFRFLGFYHMDNQAFWYYLPQIPWMVLPWTIVLVIGARRLVADVWRRDAYLERFLWSWFFGGLVFLSISVFKHRHYALPILPPLTVLTAKLLADHTVRVGLRAKRFFVIAFGVAVVVFGIVGGVVLPWRDHREARVQFVREAVGQLAPDADLYVLGLAQSMVYPYIPHHFEYINSVEDFERAFRAHRDRPMWTLTKREYLSQAATYGVRLEPLAAEQARTGYPEPETLILGRVVAVEPAASAPAATQAAATAADG